MLQFIPLTAGLKIIASDYTRNANLKINSTDSPIQIFCNAVHDFEESLSLWVFKCTLLPNSSKIYTKSVQNEIKNFTEKFHCCQRKNSAHFYYNNAMKMLNTSRYVNIKNYLQFHNKRIKMTFHRNIYDCIYIKNHLAITAIIIDYIQILGINQIKVLYCICSKCK